jgi:predicted anti-sigma-YlaC factor YlaD
LAAKTQDEELSCSECFEVLPQYVDLEIAGQVPDTRLPAFRQHLEQCAACREEYETVRELARLEVEGHPPSIDDLRRTL